MALSYIEPQNANEQTNKHTDGMQASTYLFAVVQTASKDRDVSVTANANAAGATRPAARGGWTRPSPRPRPPPSAGDPRYDPSGSISRLTLRTSSW